MINKRGIGHIEMLLSFLIFVGFVIFALYFFNPFNPDRLVKTALDYGFREIIKNTTIEIETYYLFLENMNSGDYGRKLKVDIEGVDPSDNKQVRVESESGVIINANEAADKVFFNLQEDLYESGQGSVKIKFSDEFAVPTNPTGGNLDVLYKILNYEKIKLISEKRVKALKNYYENNYNKLREVFNLPSRANFEFVLRFGEGDEISAVPKYRPQGVEIFSDMKRVEVLREDGTTKFADLTVRVW